MAKDRSVSATFLTVRCARVSVPKMASSHETNTPETSQKILDEKTEQLFGFFDLENGNATSAHEGGGGEQPEKVELPPDPLDHVQKMDAQDAAAAKEVQLPLMRLCENGVRLSETLTQHENKSFGESPGLNSGEHGTGEQVEVPDRSFSQKEKSVFLQENKSVFVAAASEQEETPPRGTANKGPQKYQKMVTQTSLKN